MDFVLYNLKLNIWTIVYKWWAVKIPYQYTVYWLGPDFNDFNDGPPNSGSVELKWKSNDKFKYE